jgi:hypothetical protein
MRYSENQTGGVKRSRIILGIAVGSGAVLLAISLVDVIPPRSLTASRMHGLRRRVLIYCQAHGELPPSLASLPAMEGYNSSIRDGWNRAITFQITTNGLVTFISLGRDGRTGGADVDADIIRSFPVRDSQGNWSDQMVDWSTDSFRK